jgi:YVTN family beta-propeller protein
MKSHLPGSLATLCALAVVMALGLQLAAVAVDPGVAAAQRPDCITLPTHVPANAGAREHNPRQCTPTPTPPASGLAQAIAFVKNTSGTTGVPGNRCAIAVGATCIVSGAVRGVGTVTGSQTWNLKVPVPAGVVAGMIPHAVFSTNNGLEGFDCAPVPAGPPATVTCAGTTTGNALAGSTLTVVFGNGANPPTATGQVVGPPNTRVFVANMQSGNVSVIDSVFDTVVATIPVGTNPFGIALNPDQTRVYVVNQGSNNVSVLDTTFDPPALKATIALPAGSGPRRAVVSPDGTRLYVTNGTSNTVSVINTANNIVMSAIPVGASPTGIVIHPDGNHLYVANTGGMSVSAITLQPGPPTVVDVPVNGVSIDLAIKPDGSKVYAVLPLVSKVVAIETNGNTQAGSIDFGQLSLPQRAVMSLDGTRLYVASIGDFNRVTVLDITGAIPTQVAAIELGTPQAPVHPAGMTLTPDGSRLYVASSLDNKVLEINTATNALLPVAISVGTQPGSVAAGATAQSRVYAAGSSSGLFIVNPADNTLIGSSTVGFVPVAVAVAPDGTVYTADQSGGTVTIKNPVSGATLATLTVPGGSPSDVAVKPDGSRVYVARQHGVSVIDTSTKAIIANLQMSPELDGAHLGIAVRPDGTRAYMTNQSKGTVAELNISVEPPVLITTVNVGTNPLGVAVTPDGSRVYVSNSGSGTVSVIDTATNAVTATVSGVGTNLQGVAVSANGNRVYVSRNSNGLAEIDTATNQVSNTLSLGASSNPLGVTTSADNTRVYVAVVGGVAVVDTNGGSFTLVTTVSLAGAGARDVAFKP